MRRELKNIAEYKKPSNDAFASVVRSFGDANSRFQALAVESAGRRSCWLKPRSIPTPRGDAPPPRV